MSYLVFFWGFSMRFLSLFIVTFVFFSLAAPLTAFAACEPDTTLLGSCIGEDCATRGTTKLDKDQANIIACLWTDSSHTAQKWKSMTSSADLNSRTWVNYDTSARGYRVPYVNNTGHVIEVNVSTYSGCRDMSNTICQTYPFIGITPGGSPYTHCSASIKVNGMIVDYHFMNSATGAELLCNAYATVPAGATYIIDNDGWGDIYLFRWSELR